MSRPSTILTTVLEAHGGYCTCGGACGRQHTGEGGRCSAETSGKNKPLLAAPRTPHATDAQNAATPVENLRPWCWPCWRDALGAERVRTDEQRSMELAQMQIGLFDLAADTAV
ncbi:hypothetical protein [Streptacidiphilus carbonis]|uniref:hypothetical protein n=1 Tax=Streptacidiphilus carbonis TaxID=105422 RepID=UPI001269EFA8|nr:hypothetical protein [Streptacidiphilus carbonis]